jgi:uncharacterized protein YrrD
MRIGKDFIGKPIYSLTDGKLLGEVKDIYLDKSLDGIMGVFVGKEGLFSRKERLIKRESVHVFGLDAILVKNSEVVLDSSQYAPASEWVRRESIQNRDVDTPGGTKVGRLGDIIVDEDALVAGFILAKVFVEGPIAETQTVSRQAMLDTGDKDGAMTVDLQRAEKPSLVSIVAEKEAEEDEEQE